MPPPRGARRARAVRRNRAVAVAILLAVGVLAVLVVRACSPDDTAQNEGAVALVSTTTSTVVTTTEVPPEGSTTSTVLAGVTGDIPGLRLELNALERQNDEVVRLAFTLINTGPTPFTFGTNFGEAGTVSGIQILDTANEERLPTLTDEASSCRCSRDLTVLAPGQRLALFAELGAPPADIGLVSVIVPHFPGVQKIRMT